MTQRRSPTSPPRLGLVEHFRPGETERVERALAELQRLGVQDLRILLPWADWYAPGGEPWLAWLLPHLGRRVRLLPVVARTPATLGVAPRPSSPPRDPRSYADYLDLLVTRFGDCFEWVELWHRVEDRREWDPRLDPGGALLAATLGQAAHRMRLRGRGPVLTLPAPVDRAWLRALSQRGILQAVAAVGLRAVGRPDPDFEGWAAEVDGVRDELARHGSTAEVWISECGHPVGEYDARGAAAAWLAAREAPVERAYWFRLLERRAGDSQADPVLDDPDRLHGLVDPDGRPNALFRAWAAPDPRTMRRLAGQEGSPRARSPGVGPALITGGAGFIGTNLADAWLSRGRPVRVLDDLSRPGVERNLAWLETRHRSLDVEVADVRNASAVRRALVGASRVVHLAAQVAVTTSVTDPRLDFDVNLRGVMNLLDALRDLPEPPPLVLTSTNKVYGALADLRLRAHGARWQPDDPALAERGLSEDRPLDFHSPYGCSKGAADQYAVDHARTYGLRATVFRMSCVYGPHQHGTEDQGWVAHFLIGALAERPITIFGDGRQVRDLLFVEDLVDAFDLAFERADQVAGRAFNLGGGPANAASLVELLERIEERTGRRPDTEFRDWRPGDQRWYVTDSARFHEATGWKPRVPIATGLDRLLEWLREDRPVPGAPAHAPLAREEA
ncbi:GDP-mannose 4,6-dehydratase [Myxococcota bacterium]|nr:GDP-mannose 4,6-dehydratase [Myxococcota bacterium]